MKEVAELGEHPAECWRLVEDQVTDAFDLPPAVEVAPLGVEQEVLLVVVELVTSFGHAVLFAEWLRY